MSVTVPAAFGAPILAEADTRAFRSFPLLLCMYPKGVTAVVPWIASEERASYDREVD